MQSKIVAGGTAADFVTVRHLRLTGTDEEIGYGLARAAYEAHGPVAMPPPAMDSAQERVRAQWFRRNYPVMHRRMRGVAQFHDLGVEADSHSLDWLGTYQLPAGCSVAFYPSDVTKEGHGLLSRNFDFPTATLTQLLGIPPLPGEAPLASDPWVVELRPDDGYASVSVSIMDVMGAMDGVNEAGLAVTLLADNETPDPEPTGAPRVGLAEQQVVRYLLDTCATADEALDALRMAKHYYFFTPCHYVVSDRSGTSFVWEHSPRRNQEIVVPARSDGRVVCTNHLLHRWPDPTALPTSDDSLGTAAMTYWRWQTLSKATQDTGVVDRDDIRQQFESVRFQAPIQEARTFWHAIYDVEDASAEVSFFVRDDSGRSVYTEPMTFRTERG
jgi:Acyl-coenzyme A:6-aminopenicillanic acid acyl-transferase